MRYKVNFFFNKWQKMSLFSPLQALIFVLSIEATDLIQALMKRAIAHKMLKIGRALTVMLLLLSTISSGFAQGWEVTIGGDNEDFGFAILQTKDEGFVVAGYSESFGSDGDFDIYVVRTDVDGNLVWEQSYDEGYIENANDVIELEDESLLIVGNANQPSGSDAGTPSQVYLLNISKKGEFLWSHLYDNDGLFQKGKKIIKTEDGGYAIIGDTERAVGESDNVLFLKLNADGEEEWRQTYGTENTEVGQGLVEVEGGYVFVSNVKTDGGFDNDIAIYRIDETGDVISSEVYGEDNAGESVNDLIKTQDGNILLTGFSNNFSYAYFIKSDLNGDTLWTREIDANLYDDELKAVTELEDGSVVAAGFTFPNPITPSILIVKMSPEGELIWTSEIGEEIAENRWGEDIIPTLDGGFAIAGYSSLGDQVFINDLAIVKVDGDGNYFTNLIEGKVFWSQDGCNPYEEGDLPLADWLVQVEGEDNRFIGTTDAEGNYSIPVDLGSYTVTILPRNDAWEVCSPSSFPIDFTALYDTLVYNFPVRSIEEACSFLTISTSGGYLVACESTSYEFSYCNDGAAIAEDAEIEIFLDDELTFESTTAGSFVETDSSIVVSLGNVEPLSCGSFSLTAAVACEGVEDSQAIAIEAQIRPINECVDPDPNWDMSSLAISGICENNEVLFRVRNVGNAPTPSIQNFVIVEDVVLFLEVEPIDPIPPNGEVALDAIPASDMGSTYRLIGEQVEGHPGNNYLTVAVEGCTQEESEDYITGIVTQFPENDQDPYIDIYVQELLDTSAGANLLIGHPKGYEDSIITTNTDIEYTVLFANSGSDTLNRLVIRDTLPAELDLATLSMGTASHPYDFELYNGGILKITFNDLNLIPADGSGVNETTNSRGYVKFTLSQKPNLPLGTTIDNHAAVYFDYVVPEVTNSIHHVVACEDFLANNGCITVNLDEPPVAEGPNIKVQPNPFSTAAVLTVENCVCNEVKLIIRDAIGRIVRQEQFSGASFTVQKNELAPALYFFEVYTENQIIQTGKLLVQ